MPDKVWVIVKTPTDANTEIVGVFGDKERARKRFAEVLGYMWEGYYDGSGHTPEECIDIMEYTNGYESLIVEVYQIE